MTIIHVTENNCECYGVTFENKRYVKLQKFQDISNDENNILCVNPLRTFLGKSQVCDMTMFSGGFDKSVFDGNTILSQISEEKDRHKYVYIGGHKVCSFLTNDSVYEYISNMGNNLTPYGIAIADENQLFFDCALQIYNKREKIDSDDSLKTNEYSLDPYDYHVSNCGEDSFEKLRLYNILSN